MVLKIWKNKYYKIFSYKEKEETKGKHLKRNLPGSIFQKTMEHLKMKEKEEIEIDKMLAQSDETISETKSFYDNINFYKDAESAKQKMMKAFNKLPPRRMSKYELVFLFIS